MKSVIFSRIGLSRTGRTGSSRSDCGAGSCRAGCLPARYSCRVGCSPARSGCRAGSCRTGCSQARSGCSQARSGCKAGGCRAGCSSARFGCRDGGSPRSCCSFRLCQLLWAPSDLFVPFRSFRSLPLTTHREQWLRKKYKKWWKASFHLHLQLHNITVEFWVYLSSLSVGVSLVYCCLVGEFWTGYWWWAWLFTWALFVYNMLCSFFLFLRLGLFTIFLILAY